MHRKFIALIVTTSIVITALSSMPARADQDETARILAALLGLAMIGVVLSEQDQASHKVNARPNKPIAPRPVPEWVNKRSLPQKCLRSFEGQRKNHRVFTQRCLNRHYKFVRSLPRHCERQFRTDRGVRRGFGVRCLRREGYKMARR